MTLDQTKLLQALMSCNVSPTNRESAAALVEGYLARLADFPDTKVLTLGVEVPWYVELGPKMFAVGQIDRILLDAWYTMCEWKTKSAPKETKLGVPYKGQDEDSWLLEIGSGPQLVTYAMAAARGRFLVDYPQASEFEPEVAEPRVLVRACLKSSPVGIWPKDPAKGVFKFTQAQVDSAQYVYSVIGTMVRSARLSGQIPWALPGNQCENKFRRVCPHLAEGCLKGIYPATPQPNPETWDPDDPGFKVAKVLGWDIGDPELVVLSQSAYVKFIECPEKFRREMGGRSTEDSSSLEIGKAFHASLAEIYRPVRS